MTYAVIIPFAVLYMVAKVMESSRLAFYKAALLYVLAMWLITTLTFAAAALFVQASWSGVWQAVLATNVSNLGMQYIVAALTLYFLDRYEDAIVAWMTTLCVGGVVLAYVVK